MSGGADKGDDGARRRLLGEFSAAHKKEFEIPQDRDFEQTVKAQTDMNAEYEYERNNLEQRFEAELDTLAHKSEPAPSYDVSGRSVESDNDRYRDITERHETGKYLADVKYSNIRDQIRDNGVTLSDEFETLVLPPREEYEASASDLEQMGIDTQSVFNSSADADYYGHDKGGEFLDSEIDFDDGYGSHYEGDFTIGDGADENDNGNDEGMSR